MYEESKYNPGVTQMLKTPKYIWMKERDKCYCLYVTNAFFYAYLESVIETATISVHSTIKPFDGTCICNVFF